MPDAINKRFRKIKTPTRLSRRPRTLEELKNWKVSEWKNWLLYYAMPCLVGTDHSNLNDLIIQQMKNLDIQKQRTPTSSSPVENSPPKKRGKT